MEPAGNFRFSSQAIKSIAMLGLICHVLLRRDFPSTMLTLLLEKRHDIVAERSERLRRCEHADGKFSDPEPLDVAQDTCSTSAATGTDRALRCSRSCLLLRESG